MVNHSAVEHTKSLLDSLMKVGSLGESRLESRIGSHGIESYYSVDV